MDIDEAFFKGILLGLLRKTTKYIFIKSRSEWVGYYFPTPLSQKNNVFSIMQSSNNQILVGTNKGLIVVDKTSNGWEITQDYFHGFPVSMASADFRTNTWWAFLAHRHWGQKMYRSNDQGENWEAIKAPTYPKGAEIKTGVPASLKNIWTFAEAGKDREGELYLGTEPGGLFQSKNGGDTFELMEGLWNHPSRMKEWFGAGRDHPYIHSVVVDPRDSNLEFKYETQHFVIF